MTFSPSRRFWKAIASPLSSRTAPITPTACAPIWSGSELRRSSPRRAPERPPIPHDPLTYKLRNRVERCFNKLRETVFGGATQSFLQHDRGPSLLLAH